jgi:hypothetical protein
MSQPQSSRSLATLALLSALLGAAVLGGAPSIAHAADEACTTTKFHYPVVEKACKEGGRKAVKPIMKAAVQKAKDQGKDIKCTSCHEDMKDFKLKDNAVADLKPLL